jgi:hypothetical protein
MAGRSDTNEQVLQGTLDRLMGDELASWKRFVGAVDLVLSATT